MQESFQASLEDSSHFNPVQRMHSAIFYFLVCFHSILSSCGRLLTSINHQFSNVSGSSTFKLLLDDQRQAVMGFLYYANDWVIKLSWCPILTLIKSTANIVIVQKSSAMHHWQSPNSMLPESPRRLTPGFYTSSSCPSSQSCSELCMKIPPARPAHHYLQPSITAIPLNPHMYTAKCRTKRER